MKGKIVSQILLASLLMSVLTLALNVQSVKATDRDNVRMYVWNPANSSKYFPFEPYPTTTVVEIWIDAPDSWTDTPQGIVGWRVILKFDPEIAEATWASQFPDLDGDGFPNGFLGVYLSNYHPEWTLGVLWAPTLIDNAGGTVTIAEAIGGYRFLGLGAGGSLTDPVTGDPLDPTPLARIAIRTKVDVPYGISLLALVDAVYVTPDGVQHPVEVVEGGIYGMGPPPAPDLAIDRVSIPAFTFPEFHSIYVTVINIGTINAGPFDVSLAFYLGGVFQGMLKETLAGLQQGSNETIAFSWEPSEYGEYLLIITVDCDNDVFELDETNNSLTGSETCIFFGDCDQDGDVDYYDFVMLAGAYGSVIGGPGYKPNCDFDHDGDVDYDDFIRFAGNYGRHI